MLEATLFSEPKVTELEDMRNQARRRKKQLTYDCFSAKARNSRVACAQGHWHNTLTLLSVLRGVTNDLCNFCHDYDDGGQTCG